MGALEIGLAVIFVEGLRKHGFNAFVAPGPNPKLFRVLIGPFADHTAYAETLRALGEIDLNTFARRYQIEASGPRKDRSSTVRRSRGSSGPTEHVATGRTEVTDPTHGGSDPLGTKLPLGTQPAAWNQPSS